MSINDPISDLIARITNAQMRRKSKCSTPGSRLRVSVLEVLKNEGASGNVRRLDAVKVDALRALRDAQYARPAPTKD